MPKDRVYIDFKFQMLKIKTIIVIKHLIFLS